MLRNLFSSFNSYTFILKYLFIYLVITQTFRTVFIIKESINFDILIYLYGLRMDVIVFFALSLLPSLFHIFNFKLLTRAYYSLVLTLLFFLEITNYFFYDEFQTRLNYLVFEYIKYPDEVLSMLWFSYKFVFLLSIVFLTLFLIFIFKKVIFDFSYNRVFYKLLVYPLIVIFLFIGIRSSLDSSTPNPSFYSHSNSVIVNDITNNSLFSLFYAAYSLKKDKKINFGKKEKETLISIENKIISTHSKKKHLTLIALESFGKSYVGVLGGTPTSPFFDKMSKDGLFMSNMYSSSSRSNRGFEAILSSAYPLSSATYLKLPKSQKDFWTIAKELKENDYETIFLYGGDSKFDNMKSFALSNGFDKVIDLYNFDSSIKKYTWGVSDEELYKKASSILKNAKKPTFLFIFSLSSHKPFDYPSENIELYKEESKESFANSIKYADFALNSFYESLKKTNYFNDSVFAVVADHNAHMFGKELIPVSEFRIPALIIAKDIVKKEIIGVSHQVDLAPTLLDAMGITTTTPSQGNNLFIVKQSQALLVHRKAYAYITDDAYAIFQKNAKMKVYNKNKEEIKNPLIIKNGLKQIYKTYDIYNNRLHKVSKHE